MMDDMMVERPTQRLFHAMEDVPSQVYYGLTIGAILLSAFLFITGRRTLALFVGQWPPTILALSLFYKLLHPSREELGAGMPEAASRVMRGR